MLLVSIIWIVLNQGCVRCAYRWQVVKADMNQLRAAQNIFYEKNNRYADTQEELINDVVFTRIVLKNITTKEEFTDGDGEGIEGSDNNPETWLAMTYIPYQKFNKWCHLTSLGYWYVCDQDGCYEEVKAPEKETKEKIEEKNTTWHNYKNEEYGVEITYPIDKLIEANFVCYHPNGEIDEQAIKFSNDEMYIYFCRFKGNYINLAESFDANNPIILNDHNGLKKKTEIRGGGREWYFLEIDNDYTLMIDTFWSYDRNQSYKEKEMVFNQMLSTFKFIK